METLVLKVNLKPFFLGFYVTFDEHTYGHNSAVGYLKQDKFFEKKKYVFILTQIKS